LRSLEEFRKNPHVKIPPKSPSTNFQSLGKFKNPIFNSEIIFPSFRPGQSCGPFSLWPSQPTSRAIPRRPKSPQPAHPVRASVASSWEIRFPFLIMPSRAGHLSLVSLSTGPHLSDPPPSPRRPTPVGNFPALLLPHAAAPRLGCPRAFTALPHHSPPLIPFKPSLNGP
jgi:hypothetical protein